MKLELLKAESESSARKAKGLAGFNPIAPRIEAAVFDQDKDDSDSETEPPATNSKGKGKAVEVEQAQHSEVESSDDDDDEDETAELLRELEKIKRERAEEKEKLVSLACRLCGPSTHPSE